MSLGTILSMGRTVANMAIHNNEGGPAFRLLEDIKRMLDALEVVGVTYAQNVPSIGQKAPGDIFGESNTGVAFDGDVVVVVNPTEVIEAQMGGDRGRFGGDAFHHTTIAAHGVDVIVKNFKARFVVTVRKPFLGDGHADAGGDALPQRTSSGFDA